MVGQALSKKTRTRSLAKQRGSLQLDLVCAMVILVVAILPLTSTIREERQLCLGLYYRSVAMSIVDGEAEILQAGEWRQFEAGSHIYPVTSEAADVLPEGRFTLNRSDTEIQLSWKPTNRGYGGPVLRSFPLPHSKTE